MYSPMMGTALTADGEERPGTDRGSESRLSVRGSEETQEERGRYKTQSVAPGEVQVR